MKEQVRPSNSFWGTQIGIFLLKNQQISYADHDSEGNLIIRRKTLLPRNLRPK